MNIIKNAVTATNENNTTVANIAQEAYVKPTIEVIEMEMEGVILGGSATGSDFGDGGYYG